MVQSMTGFATSGGEAGGYAIHIELRSVNSRFLDLVMRMPDECRVLEPMLREHISARVARGKVECRVGLKALVQCSHTLGVDMTLVGKLLEAERSVRAHAHDAAPLSVAELLRWPGVLAEPGFDAGAVADAAASLVDVALDEFVASRAREGEKLAAVIVERVEQMRSLVDQLRPRMPQLVSEQRQRLQQRLAELSVQVEPERLAQEVALFATRVDVDEELDRLVTHLDEVSRVLKAGKPAGKRLDFLMQELNREANTLASKSAATDVTAIAMDMKVLIEQMREQVQNLQ